MSDPERLLEMALELDEMDQDVNSWEADFLQSILLRLKDGVDLSPKQEKVLEDMYGKYIEGESPRTDEVDE